MPTKNLEIRQFDKGKSTYLFFRYKDDKNKNYEYQVYKLMAAEKAARDLGAPESISGRKSRLNTREKCAWVFAKK